MMVFPIHAVIFYFFAAILIGAAVMVVTAKNPVKAVLFLVLAFVASSILWMLMQAEFLSLVLIFVYVGAVMTLFLFVVMMLRTEHNELRIEFVRYYPFGLLAFILLVGIAFYALCPSHWFYANQLQPALPAGSENDVTTMGILLFTNYLYPFELAAVLLFIGMIAAIALAFHGKKSDTKSQKISEQLTATKENRLRTIDLREEKLREEKS